MLFDFVKRNPLKPRKGRPARDLLVRLRACSCEPSTAVEQLVVCVLRREGTMPYDRLVKLVAAELYEEELRSGAWLVDIGLFGSDLFVPDVAHEVSAKNGTHWQFDE